MDYEYFKNKIGSKFNIVEGELVEAENGIFTVSETYSNYVIYLNKQNKTYNLIAPLKSYIGRPYVLRKLDCVTLMFEWLGDENNKDLSSIYTKTSRKDFFKYYKEGMSLWYEDNGFLKVDTPIRGDCIVYEYKPKAVSHVGIYLGEDKFLHHLPYKLSCIDTLDRSKIIGVYRYGTN